LLRPITTPQPPLQSPQFFEYLGNTLPSSGRVRERALDSLYKNFNVVLAAAQNLSEGQVEKLASTPVFKELVARKLSTPGSIVAQFFDGLCKTLTLVRENMFSVYETTAFHFLSLVLHRSQICFMQASRDAQGGEIQDGDRLSFVLACVSNTFSLGCEILQAWSSVKASNFVQAYASDVWNCLVSALMRGPGA
jgi:hypothetical protein